MKKNILRLSLIFLNLLFISIFFTDIVSANTKNNFKLAEIHPVENSHINNFITFCSKLGIKSKLLPVNDGQRRNLFIYIENKPDYENFIIAVKLVTARYLLPLMQEMIKKNINDFGYLVLLFNIKGHGKLITATVFPNDAVMLTANRISLEHFKKRIKIKLSNS